MFPKTFTVIVILSILLSACATLGIGETQVASATPTPTVLQPEVTVPPVVIPTITATSVSEVDWTLPTPPDANQLPTQMSQELVYIEPPENCAEENNPNVTCSTIKGQLTAGEFILRAGRSLGMTGDVIDIFNDDNQVIVDRPSLTTNHDLWVLVNASNDEIRLSMLAPNGSFRGYFDPADGKWNIQKIAHLRDLLLYQFLLPTQTYDRYTPTPVPNCESVFGCEKVNVRVVVFDDTGIHIAGYGLYLENQPFWQDLLQLLNW